MKVNNIMLSSFVRTTNIDIDHVQPQPSCQCCYLLQYDRSLYRKTKYILPVPKRQMIIPNFIISTPLSQQRNLGYVEIQDMSGWQVQVG